MATVTVTAPIFDGVEVHAAEINQITSTAIVSDVGGAASDLDASIIASGVTVGGVAGSAASSAGALRKIGTGANDALAGNTNILTIGTGAGNALAGNTYIPTVTIKSNLETSTLSTGSQAITGGGTLYYKTLAITFSPAFASTPQVMATAQNSTMCAAIDTVSTTGFNLTMWGFTNGGVCAAYWMAILVV